jgi:hypothetical protein
MALAPLLRKLQRAAVPGSTAATLDNPALAARINAAAHRQGVKPDAFLVAAVRSFEREASSEEWVALLRAASACPTPGAFSFKRMIEHALDHELEPEAARTAVRAAIPPRAVA